MSTDDTAIEVLTQLSRRMTASRRMLILLRLAFCQHKAQEYRAAHAMIEQVLAPEISGALRMAEANGLGCSPANSPEIGVGPPDPPYFQLVVSPHIKEFSGEDKLRISKCLSLLRKKARGNPLFRCG